MAANESKKKPFRVLVVEDNPHVSEIFRYAFRRIVAEKLGDDIEVVVEGATDGHQAWTKLEATAGETASVPAFDLVILDLMLPVMDGTEVLSRVRANEALAPLPVIVITAGDDEACREARAAGATEVLRKPVQFAQIREVVGIVL